MGPDMLNILNLCDARRAISEGRLSGKDYILSCAARARQTQPWLHAFVTLVPDDQLEISAQGPLAGIPVGVKDIISTAGLRTTNGAAAFADHVPTEDATIVSRIRHAGGTVLGKTVTTEFAWRHPGPTVNPWNPAHTPGGSSSGSAAAVAAGIVPLALGTQTVGSIVRPAAYCGVVGFKPSYGTIQRTGTYPLSGSLDHLGFFTRSVDDAAYAFSVLADEDAPHPVVDPAGGLDPLAAPRLAIIRPDFAARASGPQWEAFDRAVALLRNAGAHIETITLPAPYWDSLETIHTILTAEAGAIHKALIAAQPDKVSDRIKALVAEGRQVTAMDYLAALAIQSELRAELTLHLKGFDAFLTIPATGEAPEGLAETGDASFCAPWTLLGVPALNLPVGLSQHGLPLGIQVAGPYLSDIQTLRAARWIEQALPAFSDEALEQRTTRADRETAPVI